MFEEGKNNGHQRGRISATGWTSIKTNQGTVLLMPTCPQCPSCGIDQAAGYKFCEGCGATAVEQLVVDPAQSMADMVGSIASAGSFVPLDGLAHCQYEGKDEFKPVRLDLKDNGLFSIKLLDSVSIDTC